jgi:hypothetical protein
MPATTYTEDKILDEYFGKQSYTVPSTIYAGICTGCTSAGVVTGEPTIGSYGYTRVAVTNSDISTTWGAASSGVKANANSTIQFGTVTGTAWGTLTVLFFSDAASGGNILWYGNLTSSLVTAVGMTPYIAANNLTITIT